MGHAGAEVVSLRQRHSLCPLLLPLGFAASLSWRNDSVLVALGFSTVHACMINRVRVRVLNSSIWQMSFLVLRWVSSRLLPTGSLD